MARQPIPEAGAWGTIAALLNSNFSELYQNPTFGVYDYEDAATAVTPISIAAAETWYPLTNDGAGPNTDKTFALPSVTDLWDTVNNQLIFTGLAIGDVVDIRLDIEVTSSAPNQDFDIDLVLGSTAEFRIPVFVEKNFKAVGAHRLVEFTNFYIGSADVLNNPGTIELRSSDTGSVKVNGWYIRPRKRVREVV